MRRGLHAVALVAALVVFQGAALEERAIAGGAETADDLIRRVIALYKIGEYDQALPLAERAISLSEQKFGPDHPEVATALGNLVMIYKAKGLFAEAEKPAQRALAITESMFGPDFPDVARHLTNVGSIYVAQKKFDEAEPLYERALTIVEKSMGTRSELYQAIAGSLAEVRSARSNPGAPPAPSAARDPNDPDLAVRAIFLSSGRADLAAVQKEFAELQSTKGPEHPDVLEKLDSLAFAYQDNGKPADAEATARRGVALSEKSRGKSHPDTGRRLQTLGRLLIDQGRPGEAEAPLGRALSIFEASDGPESKPAGEVLQSLAAAYDDQRRFAEGLPFAQRAVRIKEQLPGQSGLAVSLTTLGRLYDGVGRLDDADPLLRRALAVYETTLGAEHVDTAFCLGSLGNHLRLKGRFEEAAGLYERALAIQEKELGANSENVAASLGEIGRVYHEAGLADKAEPYLQRSLAAFESIGPDDSRTGTAALYLGGAYLDQKKYELAEQTLKRSLQIYEKSVGATNPQTGAALSALAMLYDNLGRPQDSEPLYLRSLDLAIANEGMNHYQTAIVLSNLAALKLSTRDWAAALDYARRASKITYAGRFSGPGADQRASQRTTSERDNSLPAWHVLAAFGLSRETPKQRAKLFEEGFVAAQRIGQSPAAEALTQMAARGAGGDGDLYELVRRRQDLDGVRQDLDKRLTNALSASGAQRQPALVQDLRGKLATKVREVAALDAQLDKGFPEYFDLVTPDPVTVSETKKLLRPDEVLVQFVFLGVDALALYVTPDDTQWVALPASTQVIADQVRRLRCGLDRSAWRDGGDRSCQALFAGSFSGEDARKNMPLPFDLATAHALYTTLLGAEGAPSTRGKQLLLVPVGALTTLPFHVLVSEPPPASATDAFVEAKWLGTQQPASVLPSVASLKALRTGTATAPASQRYLGFANPLLEGNPENADHVELAKLARDWQRCSDTLEVAEQKADRVGGVSGFQANGLADVAQLKRWAPLPETAIEVCEVARSLGIRDVDSNTRLGYRATESEVKSLNGAQLLKGYRIVHFATHGALGGQLKGTVEPGLLMTPPDAATTADDGYLSASEIAELRLGADWVILSACNTAAGGAGNSQALSGLARAFFYSGAKALLVSHWAVNSQATVALVTTTVEALAQNPSLGRATALQTSMAQLVGQGKAFSHPEYWAPFVVVGEGFGPR